MSDANPPMNQRSYLEITSFPFPFDRLLDEETKPTLSFDIDLTLTSTDGGDGETLSDDGFQFTQTSLSRHGTAGG